MNTNAKRIISLLLCLVTVMGILFSFAGCSLQEKTQEVDGTIILKDGKTYGKGNTAFTFVVKDAEGKETKVTVKTDKKTVGEALVENKMVAGESSEWGLMVNTVNGITLDYNKDQKYWAFYINGEYAMTGVDSTDIEAGATYTFSVEAG